MGTEHPFNPIVRLLPEAEAEPASEDAESEGQEHLVAPLAHHTFVFTPILAQAAMLAREKEANATAAASSNSSVISGKSSRTFRRQPPFYVDNMSVSGRSQWSNDPRARKVPGPGPGRAYPIKPMQMQGGGSPRTAGSYGAMNYGTGGMAQGQSSPMNMPGYTHMGPGPMMMVAPQATSNMTPGMVAAGSYPGPASMGMPMGSPLTQQGVPMPVYTQQMQQMQLHYMQQQQQIYQNYQAQMHPSMASSLSSSYGAAHSPMGGSSMGSNMGNMSHSPMAMYQQQSYLSNVMGAAQPNAPQQPQQQSHPHPHGMDSHPQRQTSPKGQAQGQQQW